MKSQDVSSDVQTCPNAAPAQQSESQCALATLRLSLVCAVSALLTAIRALVSMGVFCFDMRRAPPIKAQTF